MNTQEAIHHIEEVYQSSDLTYESMLNCFLSLSGFPFYTVPINKKSNLIRARYIKDTDSIENTKDISYPPEEYANGFSRINRPRQSYFYASESEKSCFAEMMRFWYEECEMGEKIRVVMSCWLLKESLSVIIIPDTKNNLELNQNIVSRLNENEKIFWDYISKKFKTTAKEEKNIYQFTSAFCNAILLNLQKQGEKCDGFIFTSVQSPDGLNVALNPSVIDSSRVKFHSVSDMKCKRDWWNLRDLPHYSEIIGERRKGTVDKNGKIKWKNYL